MTATQPVVMVFEDNHHADAGMLDFIDHLLEWSRGAPITVITLARPDFLESYRAFVEKREPRFNQKKGNRH